MRRIYQKIRSTAGGLNILIGILLLLIVVMLIIIAVPSWKRFSYRAQKVGCDQAMKSAGDGLIIEYLGDLRDTTSEEARRILDKVMPGRDKLCPAGGEVYLSKDEHGIYQPFCGIHGNDKKERVRLNASYAKELLSAELEKAGKKKNTGSRSGSKTEEKSGKSDSSGTAKQTSAKTEKEQQDYTEITINGKPLQCIHVLKQEPIRRGTANTNDYEGIVAYYGLEGEGDFDTGLVKKGDIAYFVYADEYYCARWSAKDGWSGDAYS